MSTPRETVEAAEQAVLSAILLDASAFVVASRWVRSEDFMSGAHRRIFDAYASLRSSDTPIDPLTLSAELERRGDLSAAGGREYLAYLVDVVPTAANVEYHAKLVRSWAHRASLAQSITRAREAIGDPSILPADIARQLQADTLNVAVDDPGSGFEVVNRATIVSLAERIEARGAMTLAGKVPGLPTGYPEIDDVTLGFRPGELVVFGAVPKAWKTALVDNIALNMLRAGFVGGKVAAEMTRDETLERMLAAESQVPTHTLSRGDLTHDQWQRFFVASRTLDGRFHVDDEAFPELGDVIARCTELKARVPDLAFLVVDYLQLVTTRLQGKRGDEEINAVCRGLKGVAKRLGVPVLAPAQCNYKEIDARSDKRPELRDLQGASGMAQTANFVGLLYNPLLYYPDARPVLEVEFAASRRTPKWTALLAMQPDCQRLVTMRKAA